MRTTITVGHVLGFFDRLAATINRAPKDGVRICHVHVEERVHRPPTDGRADHQERVADAKLRGALRVEMVAGVRRAHDVANPSGWLRPHAGRIRSDPWAPALAT